MRQPTQREYVMIGVLAAALLAWLYFGDRGIGRGGRTGVGRAQLPTGEAPIVHLDRLAALDEPFDPQGRDLFKYGPPPRTAPPPRPVVQQQPVVQKPPPQRAPAKPREPVQRPTPRPQRPIPPKPDFTYLGYLGPKDNRIAVFDLGEDEPILAQAGDVIAEAFTVVEFKYQSVVLGFTDERFKDETTELEMKN